jgi:hypothetical protein
VIIEREGSTRERKFAEHECRRSSVGRVFVLRDAAAILSAQSGIRFAVTREGSAARPLQSRMTDASNGARDLAALDGAAQARMIMNILGALGPLAVATLVADVAPRTTKCTCPRLCCSGDMANSKWREVVDAIAQAATSITTTYIGYELRSALVVKLYGGKTSLVEIADAMHLDRNTVGKYHGQIHRWLKGAKAHKEAQAAEGIKINAWRDAETSLRHHGIVG